MSKSMWIDAVECKPVKEDKMPHKSIKVLFWVRDCYGPFWGIYDSNISFWFDPKEGYFNPHDVKYFAYIDNPYK
jgi:hypothetical protein